jgi:hypothetical protein
MRKRSSRKFSVAETEESARDTLQKIVAEMLSRVPRNKRPVGRGSLSVARPSPIAPRRLFHRWSVSGFECRIPPGALNWPNDAALHATVRQYTCRR